MNIKRFKQSCFLIKINQQNLYIDPYGIPDDAAKADLILITHCHSDHSEKSSLENIFNGQTIVICPEACQKIIQKRNAKPVKPRLDLEEKGIKIETIPMYNLRWYRMLFHRKSKELCGYIICAEDKRIYHAGDTDIIPEMEQLENIDYALLPIGGFFTMNKEEALKAIEKINPKKVIPMHNLRTDLEEFKYLVKERFPNIEVIILKENEVYTLERKDI